MAVGITATSDYTRNKLIVDALKKLRAFPDDGRLSFGLLEDMIRALNRLVRHEDLRGVGQTTDQWSISSAPLLLTASSQIYSSVENLKTNILDIRSIVYRNSDGVDTPIGLISKAQYDALAEKDETGDPQFVYLERKKLLADQRFWVHPVLSSISSGSTVLGTDGSTTFTCILGHTAATTNRPTTGASWELYWHAIGSGGSAWVAGTSYTNQELLYFSYKAPLFDFGGPYDNPSFPSGWSNYLVWKLVVDQGPNFNIPLEERLLNERQMEKIYAELVPSRKTVSTEIHNKNLFF